VAHRLQTQTSMKPSLLLAFLALTSGCAATASSDPTTNEDPLASWLKVTSCDDGAMVVDVAGYPMTPAPGHDPDYAVQAVVRDRGILDYLEGRGAIARRGSNRSEAIVPGHVWLSTFHTSRFDGSFTSELPNGVSASLARFGDGIKLTFTREEAAHVCPSFCVNPSDPEYNPSSGVCEGCVAQPGRQELASWWFARCPVLADVHR
jgi:hypothetical protein